MENLIIITFQKCGKRHRWTEQAERTGIGLGDITIYNYRSYQENG